MSEACTGERANGRGELTVVCADSSDDRKTGVQAEGNNHNGMHHEECAAGPETLAVMLRGSVVHGCPYHTASTVDTLDSDMSTGGADVLAIVKIRMGWSR